MNAVSSANTYRRYKRLATAIQNQTQVGQYRSIRRQTKTDSDCTIACLNIKNSIANIIETFELFACHLRKSLVD